MCVCVPPVCCCPHVVHDRMFSPCAPSLLALLRVHQSALTCTCLCVVPHCTGICAASYIMACVCVSMLACLTRVPGPYVTSSLTGPHDRDRGAGQWPRVGLTPPDPQMPVGLCVCARAWPQMPRPCGPLFSPTVRTTNYRLLPSLLPSFPFLFSF